LCHRDHQKIIIPRYADRLLS